MSVIKALRGRSFKLKNAIITVHAFSAGSVILNTTGSTGNVPNHAAIIVGYDELEELGRALVAFSEEAPEGLDHE